MTAVILVRPEPAPPSQNGQLQLGMVMSMVPFRLFQRIIGIALFNRNSLTDALLAHHT